MSWKTGFLESAGPGLIPGITISKWVSILRKANFRVGWRHWPRAAMISGASVLNSIGARVEKLIFERKIRKQPVAPPVFILGCWRSGTTFLQNMLSQDARFGFPNLYQTLFPAHFLYTERILARLFDLLVPQTRPQDNVKLAMNQPSEEEIAMCAFEAMSHLIGDTMTMTANREYESYITLDQLSNSELQQWKKSYSYFIRKLSVRHQKPLMLKSPAHTGRISKLLELFPEAKFITLHRHPHDVFRSGISWLKNTRRYWGLQSSTNEDIADLFARNYGLVMNSYFDSRHLIASNRLVEISYEELEQDPLAQLERVYSEIDLPSFSESKPHFQDYLDGLKNYSKNRFHTLPDNHQEQIWRSCPRVFSEWGYESLREKDQQADNENGNRKQAA